MDIEKIREICVSKPFATECFPFDETTLVFKVHEKVFALLLLKHPHRLNLKCDPDEAIQLRETYNFVLPGYHMNKKHWNTITDIENVPDSFIIDNIHNSYQLVWNKLPLRLRSK
ncbi:MmcQ/YjbR family DNA-binding protein [Halosquirtibacter laminarini]|uniref:MmcQ/YjbR family DNA-binding protein n=1 Tax=Halosquirtibacter laminarini TaxID=3374600 RepID=A0AC61NR17_9BACT|nr:MmcQ/YjbR family DNA-binding protein [Prolixibacteraceae bacterium]